MVRQKTHNQATMPNVCRCGDGTERHLDYPHAQKHERRVSTHRDLGDRDADGIEKCFDNATNLVTTERVRRFLFITKTWCKWAVSTRSFNGFSEESGQDFLREHIHIRLRRHMALVQGRAAAVRHACVVGALSWLSPCVLTLGGSLLGWFVCWLVGSLAGQLAGELAS